MNAMNPHVGKEDCEAKLGHGVFISRVGFVFKPICPLSFGVGFACRIVMRLVVSKVDTN